MCFIVFQKVTFPECPCVSFSWMQFLCRGFQTEFQMSCSPNQNQQSRHRFEITTGCSKFRFQLFLQTKTAAAVFLRNWGHINLSPGAVLVRSRPNALIVFYKTFRLASAVRQMPNEKLAHGAHGDLQHMDWTKSLRLSLWER